MFQHELVPADICKPILFQPPSLSVQPIKTSADRSCEPLQIVSGQRLHLMCNDVEGSESRTHIQHASHATHTHTQRQMKIKKKTQKHFLKQWDINSVGHVKFKKVSEMLLRKIGTVALWWDKERKQGKRRECKGVREEQNICVLLLLLLFFLTTTGSFNHDILKQNRLNEVLTLMAVIFDFEGFVR